MFHRCWLVTLVALALALVGRLGVAADPPAADVSCFFGESKMTTPDGKLLRTSVSLVKRVVRPADGRIEEHVLSVGEKDSKAFVVTLQVTGSMFKVTERSKAFTGEGELVGEAWKWKEWKSVTKLGGEAGTVTSVDKITDRGLVVKKAFAGPDGKVVVKFEDVLAPISETTYDLLYSKLAPADRK